MQSEALLSKIVNKMEGLSKPRKNFIKTMLILYLSLRGRYTFKGMERYGDRCEKTFRLHFEQRFDFLDFNLELSKGHLSGDRLIVFDPCYLPKSGKSTAGVGKFFSGASARLINGIEIGALAVVDIKQKTAINLEAIQTPNALELTARKKTLVGHYAQLIIERWDKLGQLSSYVAVDGWFSKKSFVDPIMESTNLHLICKLRSDANLRYLYNGPKRQGKGRPKHYDGKVNLKQIDKEKFKCFYQDQHVILYQAALWSVFLKRKINLVYAQSLKQGKTTRGYTLYYSTDLDLDPWRIYQYYKARFQIEFLFRDAKQHTGLTHCQARSQNKIHFHTNMALTAVGVAKIAHYFNENKEQKTPFSMANIKTRYFNELMLNLFFSNLQINPKLIKNRDAIHKLMNFGRIAA